jgi:hypothetical protein
MSAYASRNIATHVAVQRGVSSQRSLKRLGGERRVMQATHDIACDRTVTGGDLQVAEGADDRLGELDRLTLVCRRVR